jgi:hypothetical protein
MELINLNVSEWGFSLTSYLGDVFIYWRTIALVAGIFIVLRIAKVIRNNSRLKARRFG